MQPFSGLGRITVDWRMSAFANPIIPVTGTRSPVIRRLALALAVAQLAVFTGARVIEGIAALRGEAVLGPTAGNAPAGVVLAHNPADCAACSLVHAKALAPQHDAPAAPVATPAQSTPRGTLARATRAADSSVLSRAPPAVFV